MSPAPPGQSDAAAGLANGAVATGRGSVAAGPPPSPREAPVGEVQTSIGRDRLENTPARTVADVLRDSPGVTVKQGNGPRDVVVSIRGNNARTVAGIRNTQVFEDGFPVTQPDGFSRFDLTDPHAYSRVDVFRGPQSPLFGNFATGGALGFVTRRGAEINGVEYGTDAGNFGYLNNYATFAGVSGPFEYSLFTSDVRGTGFISQNAFDTQTVNVLGTYTVSPTDRVTVKIINNTLFTEQPVRQSLDKWRLNPYQRGCTLAATAAPGCGTINLFANGAFGATVPVAAEQANLFRDDRRTIVGARWEHDFDVGTTWRTQLTFDDRNVFQPFLASVVTGDYPSYNLITDVTSRGEFLGMPATGYAAFSFNTLSYNNPNYNLAPRGNGTLGALQSLQEATQSNLGGRVRGEVNFADGWLAAAGVSAESTRIDGRNYTYTYSAAGRTVSPALADRDFLNVAPELSLIYRPSTEWQFRGRVATGYATPSASNLFVTPTGVPGNNTGLKTQENLGFDLGADWSPLPTVTLSATGFYEFFRNELVTQSPGAGLLSYTFNAPASEHRGVEFLAKASLPSGWNALVAYTYDNQIYTSYVEQLSAGARTTRLDRAGNFIPGVPQNELTARVGYDQPFGPYKGLGAYVETVVQNAFFLDNANLVKVPGYGLLNANVHYVTDVNDGFLRRISVYVECRNILDRKYVGSASVVGDSISSSTGLQNGASVVAAATGSIYAGAPRTFVGGFRLTF